MRNLMEKKELPKINIDDIIPAPKKAGFGNRIFAITKFILGICLLPFVYSTTLTFLSEISLLETLTKDYFFNGVTSFVAVYLFIYEPAIIYNKGHKILEKIFRFFAPLVKVAPYLLPIYTIILFFICGLFITFNKNSGLVKYFIFLFGFSIALHLVFSAKTLRARKGDFLKGNYIFGFSFVYIVNLIILAFGLNLLFDKFSFVNFCNNSFQTAGNMFYSILKQLFL